MTAVNDNPSVSDAPRPVVASPLIRLLAVLYDGMLLLALVVFVGAILVIAATSGEQARTGHAAALSASFRYGVMFPAFVLTVWGFYGLFWTRIGQTLGMQTWRLKTVRPDGRLLDWPTALLRCAMACVLPLICALAGYWLHHTAEALVLSAVSGFVFNYLLALFNAKRLAVHDILSATLTLRMPPGDRPEWLPWGRKRR